MSHYEYVHHAGYSRDDHLADELIARACRLLGADTGTSIAAMCGFASHACPPDGVNVRIPSGRGMRAKMERALARARREFISYPWCRVDVVCAETWHETVGETVYTVRAEREGRRWVVVDRRRDAGRTEALALSRIDARYR